MRGLIDAMTPARLFVLLTALFAALATWFIPRMDASGDEPHYLVMAQSLWQEHDLDLRDNYAREDWREFRGGSTEPHYAAPRQDGRPFPGHAPGLPFLLAPIYAIGGRLACATFLGMLVAAAGALTFGIAASEGLSRRAALLGGLLAAGPPLAAFALHIYTEAAAALALVAAYALVRFGQGRPLYAASAAALACGLPFLHPRMAVGSVAIAIAAFVLRDRVFLSAFAGVTLIGATLYALFWMSIFGTPTGLGTYGGVPEDATFQPAQAFIGFLFDRAYGLLPIAPAFAGLVLLGWPRPSTDESVRWMRVEAAFVVAVVLPAVLWRMWWGGQSPPARLIAPMIPFLALWLARQWDSVGSPALRGLVIAVAAWSWGLFLFAAFQPGRLLFINKRVRPTRLWDALWPGGPLDGWLPDMARPESSDWNLALAWMTALFVAAVIARIFRVRAARPRALNHG